MLFAAIPAAPDVPVYVKRSGGDTASGLEPYITISWEEPLDKGGVQILGYQVKMNKDAGAFSLAYDGAVEPNIRQFKF